MHAAVNRVSPPPRTSTLVAGLPRDEDREALCLALEVGGLEADVVLLPSGGAALEHLRRCHSAAPTPSRRWPDLILLDAALPELVRPAWQKEFASLLARGGHSAAFLILADRRDELANCTWCRPPQEVVVRLGDTSGFIRGLGELLGYWLHQGRLWKPLLA